MAKKQGFTLSELLVALGILSVIATYTIPKVLHAQQSQQKRAVFRETISALAQAQHIAIIKGELDKSVAPSEVILPYMNAIRICDTNASTQSCWPQIWDGPYDEETEAGFSLASGATIAGISIDAIARGADSMIVDWNGSGAPNLEGEDQLYMVLCYDSTGATFTARCPRGISDYVDYSPAGDAAAAQALWEWIFE